MNVNIHWSSIVLTPLSEIFREFATRYSVTKVFTVVLYSWDWLFYRADRPTDFVKKVVKHQYEKISIWVLIRFSKLIEELTLSRISSSETSFVKRECIRSITLEDFLAILLLDPTVGRAFAIREPYNKIVQVNLQTL